MPLKDYTTTVTVSRSVAEITRFLVAAGARGVAQEYTADGGVRSLTFAIPFAGVQLTYLLPVDAEAVRRVLLRQKVSPRYLTTDHCDRVAWRILRDWVSAQAAIIETQMVTFQQVMLPYMRTEDGATVFDHFKTQHALPAGSTHHA
jgi:hypothetical protein